MHDDTQKRHILVVDDDEFNLEILVRTVEDQGFVAIPFSGGPEAWEFLENSAEYCDVAVLDKMMPKMDGMELLKRIKKHEMWKDMPVIIQTGDVGSDQMRESIDSGAFYYLTKPFSPEVLAALLHSAEREVETRRTLNGYVELGSSLSWFMREGEFSIRTPAEAQKLAAGIARLTQRPRQVSAGLYELMLNGIEHGNLEIGYDLKRSLLTYGKWEEEINNRLHMSSYENRMLRVKVEPSPDGVKIAIRDEGPGFRWQDYVIQAALDSPLTGPNGRGIAKATFWLGSRLYYDDSGNTVSCRIPNTWSETAAAVEL